MIKYLKGKLVEVGVNSLILETGGIGYELGCTGQMANQMTRKINKEVLIWTFLKLKEDGVDLYGFANKDEVDLFIKLNKVSGVGPRSALSMMNLGELRELVMAIDGADISYISKANGVGKKTAQRLIMELKGKLVFEDESGLDNEVVAALKSLGYTKSEYEDMMKLIPNDLEKSEEKIGWILKRLGR